MRRIELWVEGFRREYLLFPCGGKESPLVLFLHGMGATASWAERETGWSQLAIRQGFTLVLPEALSPNLDHPPRFLTNPQRWNDGCPTSPPRGALADDVTFIAQVINDVQGRVRIDPARVFLSGFSNGAAMAFRGASGLADRIAAIAPVAGYCWVPDPQLARPIPTLYLIGSIDPVVPQRGGEVRSPWQHRYVRRPPVSDTLERWASALGCATAPRTESNSDGVLVESYPGPVRFEVITIGGLGHHWPGGKGQFNPRIAGPPSDRINATERIWDFFQQHSL